MSSTNKTTHYNLSQYIASDKPTYLVDYNSDMSNIDTGIHEAKAEADTNTAAIGSLSDLNTTVKSDLVSAVNEVEGRVDTLETTVSGHTTSIATNTSAIGTLANLETSNKSNLVNAINEVNYNINLLNIVNFDIKNQSDINISGGTYSGGSITIATNSNNSIGKIYGTLVLRRNSNSGCTISISSNIRPSEAITINCLFAKWATGAKVFDMGSVTINTNGEIVISMLDDGLANDTLILNIVPCLLFFKDFGDTPSQ